MKKEFNMLLIIVVCAILGLVSAVLVYQFNSNGIIVDEIIAQSDTITIDDLMFFVFFAWMFLGIIIGVLKK